MNSNTPTLTPPPQSLSLTQKAMARLLLITDFLTRDGLISPGDQSLLKTLVLKSDKRMTSLLDVLEQAPPATSETPTTDLVDVKNANDEADTAKFIQSLHALLTTLKTNIFNKIYASHPIEVAKTQSKSERSAKKIMGDRSLIYGEVEFGSFLGILGSLGLPYTNLNVNGDGGDQRPSKKFIDLGSGSGRAVYTAALSGYFDECVGFEVIENLHDLALTVQSSCNASRSMDGLVSSRSHECKVTFKQSDFLNEDWSSAKLIFANSTCFTPQLMSQIAVHALTTPQGTLIITFTKPLNHPGYSLVSKKRYNMSWGPATVFVSVRGSWLEVGPNGGVGRGGGVLGVDDGDGDGDGDGSDESESGDDTRSDNNEDNHLTSFDKSSTSQSESDSDSAASLDIDSNFYITPTQSVDNSMDSSNLPPPPPPWVGRLGDSVTGVSDDDDDDDGGFDDGKSSLSVNVDGDDDEGGEYGEGAIPTTTLSTIKDSMNYLSSPHDEGLMRRKRTTPPKPRADITVPVPPMSPGLINIKHSEKIAPISSPNDALLMRRKRSSPPRVEINSPGVKIFSAPMSPSISSPSDSLLMRRKRSSAPLSSSSLFSPPNVNASADVTVDVSSSGVQQQPQSPSKMSISSPHDEGLLRRKRSSPPKVLLYSPTIIKSPMPIPLSMGFSSPDTSLNVDVTSSPTPSPGARTNASKPPMSPGLTCIKHSEQMSSVSSPNDSLLMARRRKKTSTPPRVMINSPSVNSPSGFKTAGGSPIPIVSSFRKNGKGINEIHDSPS